MGLLNFLFGSKTSCLTADTLQKIKIFLAPQMLAHEKEGIEIVVSNKTIAYIYFVAEKIGGKSIQDNELEKLLISVCSNESSQKKFRTALLNLQSAPNNPLTCVMSEMKKQANSDVLAGGGTFLFTHTKSVRKGLDAMYHEKFVPFEFDNTKPMEPQLEAYHKSKSISSEDCNNIILA